VRRSIEKSTRLASSSGSTTCQPIVPWTTTVWKSRLRPRTNKVISRSSTGTSLMLAVSGRNQKTRPRPLCRTRPLRKRMMWLLASLRSWAITPMLRTVAMMVSSKRSPPEWVPVRLERAR